METITLTQRELLRLRTTQRIVDRGLSLAEGASALGLSERQLKRLVRRLRECGPAAFASSRRGRSPNNALSSATRERILDLASTTYRDFGPAFLTEKLAERDGISVSRESVRTLLISAGLHRTRRRRLHPRPLRERRPRVGELLQADGSPHRWFEDRGASCCLLLVNDDATSRIMDGRFVPCETTNAYFELFRRCFTRHGRPLAVYTDKHSIFRSPNPTAMLHETQVQRALRELGVELICANSPQAKGRIERANRTLQDRLVKELRLHGISTIDAANEFLPQFIEVHNTRYAKPPKLAEDAHRTIDGYNLDAILSRHVERKLTKDLCFQINDMLYAIKPSAAHRLRGGMRITVMERTNGQLAVFWKGIGLTLRSLGEKQRRTPIATSKDLNPKMDRRVAATNNAHIPPMSHPWKGPSYRARIAKLARASGDTSALRNGDRTALR